MKKELYNRYSSYLNRVYGEKVYKLPVNLPVTCPNRTEDGGGCTFCGGLGAGFENLSSVLSVREQLLQNMAYMGKKYKAKKFIAYFQNFTNTYLPVPDFSRYMEEAATTDSVVALSVSTRPDCIRREYLESLREMASRYGVSVTVELGLQSVNYHTLKKIHRGHGLAEYIEAALLVKSYGFSVCTHMILNLPWDGREDVCEGARVLAALNTDFVKLHALYIEKGTAMADGYLAGSLSICSAEEYMERVVCFLELLPPDMVVERLISRAPKENTLFANWGMSWWRIQDGILERMQERGTFQGKKFQYLGGKAVSRFFPPEQADREEGI